MVVMVSIEIVNMLEGLVDGTEEFNVLEGFVDGTEEFNVLEGLVDGSHHFNVLEGLIDGTEEFNVLDSWDIGILMGLIFNFLDRIIMVNDVVMLGIDGIVVNDVVMYGIVVIVVNDDVMCGIVVNDVDMVGIVVNVMVYNSEIVIIIGSIFDKTFDISLISIFFSNIRTTSSCGAFGFNTCWNVSWDFMTTSFTFDGNVSFPESVSSNFTIVSETVHKYSGIMSGHRFAFFSRICPFFQNALIFNKL
jgi:hypothetical protein